MFAKRTSPLSSRGSAAVARARLMGDPATRRHTPHAAPPPRRAAGAELSATDQERHIRHVLRSFHFFHLADLSYDPTRQVTTAIFRPNQDHDDVPHKIQIDARGNLLVTRLGPYPIPARWRDWQLWLVSGIALVMFCLTFLILI